MALAQQPARTTHRRGIASGRVSAREFRQRDGGFIWDRMVDLIAEELKRLKVPYTNFVDGKVWEYATKAVDWVHDDDWLPRDAAREAARRIREGWLDECDRREQVAIETGMWGGMWGA